MCNVKSQYSSRERESYLQENQSGAKKCKRNNTDRINRLGRDSEKIFLELS